MHFFKINKQPIVILNGLRFEIFLCYQQIAFDEQSKIYIRENKQILKIALEQWAT